MIVCKRPKTPYNANKWILGVLSKWEYASSLLCAYISYEFVFLWCTLLYIECFRCVIDKCNHYLLISKIFDMVFAGGGRAIWLYAIEFHATVFHLNICSCVHMSCITKTHAWMVVHMSVYVNTWTNVHMYKWLYTI